PAKLLHLSDHFVHLSIYLAFWFAQGGDDCARGWGEFGHSRSQKRKTWFSQVSISCLARRRSASCALRQCSDSHGDNSQSITRAVRRHPSRCALPEIDSLAVVSRCLGRSAAFSSWLMASPISIRGGVFTLQPPP